MKTEEDEAFDNLAKRQGAWGGGFPAKRAMAADKLHWSDCAVHNGPAYPAGECDCGVAQEPINLLEARKIAAEYKTPDSQIDSGNLYFALSKCLEHIDAQPAQEPIKYLDVAYKLAQKELGRLVAENFGRMPQDKWADSVLDLRDHLESQPAQEPVAFDAFLESEDFYNLMQTYRHFQTDAIKPFEAVKNALRAAHNIKKKNI